MRDGKNTAVSLVTGGVRGLGLACARRLRERGERVHVVYRSSVEAARSLEQEFGEGRLQRADVTLEAQLEPLIARVLERDGRLDHLVHAVGAFAGGSLGEASTQDLRELMQSNVESALATFGAARAALRESRGCALFFGCAGLEGLRAKRRTALYAAAKSALIVLARSLAVEEAPHGVRVNVLSPGLIPHPDAAPETLALESKAHIPMGRAGTPREVAEAVAFLCSEEASYVTGANLELAGGWMI